MRVISGKTLGDYSYICLRKGQGSDSRGFGAYSGFILGEHSLYFISDLGIIHFKLVHGSGKLTSHLSDRFTEFFHQFY